MQKMGEMAGALFKAQRNTGEVSFLFNATEPIHNHGLEFAFENVRHTLNRGCISAVSRTGHKLCRFAHCVLQGVVIRHR